jgi:hypothetical protein
MSIARRRDYPVHGLDNIALIPIASAKRQILNGPTKCAGYTTRRRL